MVHVRTLSGRISWAVALLGILLLFAACAKKEKDRVPAQPNTPLAVMQDRGYVVEAVHFDGSSPSGVVGDLVTKITEPNGHAVAGSLNFYVDGFLPLGKDISAGGYQLPIDWKEIAWQDAQTGAIVLSVKR